MIEEIQFDSFKYNLLFDCRRQIATNHDCDVNQLGIDSGRFGGFEKNRLFLCAVCDGHKLKLSLLGFFWPTVYPLA